jgi:CDP-diacylglycerol--glycerol-3-phosphate 3-phosphatidyltransferase
MKLNLPNKLTVLRLCLVPIVMIFILYPALSGYNATVQAVVCTLLFILTAITDFIDGKIARKYNLITDFGKFMDPIADKFMVIGALVCITASNQALAPFMVWVSIIVIFRELGITSIRLVVANSGVVVPANWLGKCKTMAQSISICIFLLEGAIWDKWILSYVGMAVTAFLTLWSGFVYFKAYWKYIDPTK